MEQRPQGCGVCPASTPSLRGSIFLYILNNKKHVSNVLINSSPEEVFFFQVFSEKYNLVQQKFTNQARSASDISLFHIYGLGPSTAECRWFRKNTNRE